MAQRTRSIWRESLNAGLIAGIVSLLLALVGMVEAFATRDIIFEVIPMGQILLLAGPFVLAVTTARKISDAGAARQLAAGLLIGLVSGAVLVAVRLIGEAVNLRAVLINASPTLYEILGFERALMLGALLRLGVSTAAGVVGASLALLGGRLRNAILQAIMWLVLLGLLRDLMVIVIDRWGPVTPVFRWMFATRGLTVLGAVAVFVVMAALAFLRGGKKAAVAVVRPPRQQRVITLITMAGITLVLLLLPPVLGTFFSQVLDSVGLYILMGLGLNIVVGFAGLLDLGYVAFYAIGAYTMGVFTSPELGFFNLTWFQALPVALVVSAFAGLVLGLPVLKMRGDYLAIVTLGFGEIVRILALSDWLRPWLGGSQGIQLIQQPTIGSYVLGNQMQLYYVFLAGCAIVAFVAWRLKDSRLGRAWMAIREDEDVAVAMGIPPVATKLMAFAVGATFSGLGGSILAAQLTSVYAHSMNFFVSINVLSLIIIGGMGSIPGVILGALALIGLPELLREFAEFRYLVYGALLVGMMLLRPEGLAPEARRQLELHEEALMATGEASAEPAAATAAASK
jgi:branched-chain amino acid transport system permease protein